jgi:hypothetical protein
MDDRIIKADRKARKLALVMCVIGVLVAVVLMGWVVPWGMARLEREEPRTVLSVLEAATAVVFLSVVPMAIYLYRFGRGVVRHRQLPPPGTRLMVDTRLIEGERAVRRGRLVMALAGVLLALGLLGGLGLPCYLEKVFSARLQGSSSAQVEQPSRAPAP